MCPVLEMLVGFKMCRVSQRWCVFIGGSCYQSNVLLLLQLNLRYVYSDSNYFLDTQTNEQVWFIYNVGFNKSSRIIRISVIFSCTCTCCLRLTLHNSKSKELLKCLSSCHRSWAFAISMYQLSCKIHEFIIIMFNITVLQIWGF